VLAAAAGLPAGDYLGQAGEAAFRQLEERVTLAALAGPGRTVLALGGGAVLSVAVRDRLQQTALWTVFLTAPAAVLAARVAASSTPRPPLTQLPPAAEAAAILRARMPLYGAVARQTLDTARRGVDAVAAGIVEGMRAAGRD
jgi:shikimate kinase